MTLAAIGDASEIPDGTRKMVQVGDESIVICNVDGSFFAIGNVCPHRGAFLGQGPLHGKVLTCPWHQWQFDVTTGCGLTNPISSVRKYEIVVRDGQILLQV